MANSSVMYRVIRAIGKPLMHIVFHPTIVNREKIPVEGAILLCGNHKHALDPILVDISTKRIVRTLAKKDLFDGPFGFVFRGVRCIPVDLHKNKNPKAYDEALSSLRNGDVVNISPEAKRNFTNEVLLPFKYGAVSLASKTDTKIVPYSITGDYKFIGGHLKIVYGDPIDVSEDLTKYNENLYNAIGNLLLNNFDEATKAQKHYTSFAEWEEKKEKEMESKGNR